MTHFSVRGSSGMQVKWSTKESKGVFRKIELDKKPEFVIVMSVNGHFDQKFTIRAKDEEAAKHFAKQRMKKFAESLLIIESIEENYE